MKALLLLLLLPLEDLETKERAHQQQQLLQCSK
jgi:hypothetical protein